MGNRRVDSLILNVGVDDQATAVLFPEGTPVYTEQEAGWVPEPVYIEGVSRLVDITAGGDFLGLCDKKSSYKHVSDFGRLRSYDRLKLGIEGNDY